MTTNGHVPLEQEAVDFMVWPKPCVACGEKAILGRANYKLVPQKLVSIQASQAKVAGTKVPQAAFIMCFACGHRPKIRLSEDKQQWIEEALVSSDSASPGAIGG